MNDEDIVAYLKKAIEYLTTDLTKHLNTKKDTDLLNIRDELIAALTQTLYLFTLS